MRPVDPLLVDFLPKFLTSLLFKSLKIRGSFADKYGYSSLINHFDVIAIAKTSQLLLKSHIQFKFG